MDMAHFASRPPRTLNAGDLIRVAEVAADALPPPPLLPTLPTPPSKQLHANGPAARSPRIAAYVRAQEAKQREATHQLQSRPQTALLPAATTLRGSTHDACSPRTASESPAESGLQPRGVLVGLLGRPSSGCVPAKLTACDHSTGQSHRVYVTSHCRRSPLHDVSRMPPTTADRVTCLMWQVRFHIWAASGRRAVAARCGKATAAVCGRWAKCGTAPAAEPATAPSWPVPGPRPNQRPCPSWPVPGPRPDH